MKLAKARSIAKASSEREQNVWWVIRSFSDDGYDVVPGKMNHDYEIVSSYSCGKVT